MAFPSCKSEAKDFHVAGKFGTQNLSLPLQPSESQLPVFVRHGAMQKLRCRQTQVNFNNDAALSQCSAGPAALTQ